jgi:tetratricopeptide (TPR) repeat protein
LLQVAGEQYSSALKLCPDSPEVFLKYGSVLAHCARSINGEESDVLFAVCFSFYAKAAIPSFFMYEHALAIWGDVLVDWAGKKDGQEALIILGKACSKLEEALIVNRDNAMIHFYFGRALHRLATKEKDERKKDLAYLDSISKLQRAAELSPADIYILNEFGATLHEYSMTKTGVEADGLYQRAIDQYARAFELSGSKDAWTLRKWADTYYDWAKSKFCEHYARGQTFSPSDLQAVQTLLKSALEKYEQAIVLDSKYINALNSGALAASTLARLVDDEEEVSRLFGLAYQRFSRAIEASPQDCSIEKCNWAMVLASQAIRQRELAEQKKSFSDFVQRSIQALFEQAKSIIQPLVEKQDKWAYFCMARVCACVGDQFHEDECQRYLIACQDQHFLQKASIWQMTYFDLVKDRDWFKQLKLSQ